MSGFTAEQRRWLKELGSMLGTPLASAPELSPAPPAREAAVVRASRAKVQAALFDGKAGEGGPGDLVKDLPGVADLAGFGAEVIDIIKKLGGGRRICAIECVNNTSRTIFLGNVKHRGGGFKKLPPRKMGPGDAVQFVASSPEPLPLDIPSDDCEGRLEWLLDGDTTWFIDWDNPIAGSVKSDTGVAGVNEAKFSPDHIHGNGNTAPFRFTLLELGASPNPNPKPTPGPDVIQSSCLVTVKNDTAFPLRVKKFKNLRGDFMNPPNLDIAPNGVDQDIILVETPRAPDEGCAAFIEYEVGDPPFTLWRCEWDNPEGAKNSAQASLSPPTDAVASVEGIRQGDENVKVGFVLRPGRGGVQPVPPNPGPVPPNPGPIPPPEPEPEIDPTPEGKQPTLRKGMKSADGWVEYLQNRLNETIKAGLNVDGDFGDRTLAAVKKFQTEKKLTFSDGVVGDETWSALRDGPREKPGTDGRKPNTFVEKGAEARWNSEKQHGVFVRDLGFLILQVESVGTDSIEGFEAVVEVTLATGKKTKKFKIGPPQRISPTGAGHEHVVKIDEFKKVFGIPKDAPVAGLPMRAKLPKELGGDLWEGVVVEG